MKPTKQKKSAKEHSIEETQKPKEEKQVSPEIEKAIVAAEHFGFIELPHVEISKTDISSAKKFDDCSNTIVKPWSEECDRFSGYLEEKIAIIRTHTEEKWNNIAIPLMGYYTGPLKGNTHLVRNTDTKTFNLEIIGSHKPIAEAVLIETAYVILKERYPGQNFFVEINSIGDRDSMTKFNKELQNYCRKESGKLGSASKALIKKDIYNTFYLKDDKSLEFVENAPKPMTFLSDTSRQHFKEVLEYLESLGIPFEINHKLIGSRSYCSETVFEIKSKDQVFAIGERYNGLAKKIWNKKDVPAIGIAMLIHPHYVSKKVTKSKKQEAPKFYFIQFGDLAKKKSLCIIESLRKAKIPVHQSLSKDKLSVQLAQAEKMNIPYIIMLGQKEALEETVVVRHMVTRAQETIEIDLLVTHLKGLK